MIKFKLYSKYTNTDSLKVSSDSAILDKDEKKSSIGTTGILTGAGAILGAASRAGGSSLSKLAGGTAGALIGAGAGLTASAISKMDERRRRRDHYNRRLREAKRAAARREEMQWEAAINRRESYE